MADEIVERVAGKLRERSEAGFRKYGVTLQRVDLSPRRWAEHLQEELLDAANYIERILADGSLSVRLVRVGALPLDERMRMSESGVPVSSLGGEAPLVILGGEAIGLMSSGVLSPNLKFNPVSLESGRVWVGWLPVDE